jgi:hypothetical protein
MMLVNKKSMMFLQHYGVLRLYIVRLCHYGSGIIFIYCKPKYVEEKMIEVFERIETRMFTCSDTDNFRPSKPVESSCRMIVFGFGFEYEIYGCCDVNFCILSVEV